MNYVYHEKRKKNAATIRQSTSIQVSPSEHLTRKVDFPRNSKGAILGLRVPNKEAVIFALAIGQWAIDAMADHPELTHSDLQDLLYDACETFPVTMLSFYIRLVRDRDSDFALFSHLHNEGKSVDRILAEFRRQRRLKAN